MKHVMLMLNEIAKHAAQNKMDATNLSTVWAPNLIRNQDKEKEASIFLAFSKECNQLVQIFIHNAQELFTETHFHPEVQMLENNVTPRPSAQNMFEQEQPRSRSGSIDDPSEDSSSFEKRHGRKRVCSHNLEKN